MRFGVCSGLEQANQVIAAGFDYVEAPAYSLTEALDAWRRIPISCTNLFFSGSVRFYGDSETDWRAEGAKAIESAREVGAKVMVLGSGGARKKPHGWTDEQALDSFVAVAKQLQIIAEWTGMRIAPEALNRKETDVANDLPQLALALRLQGLDYTADAYHSLVERALQPESEQQKTWDEFWESELPFSPVHVHISSIGRTPPKADDESLISFFRRLRVLDYDETVSIEANWLDFEPATLLEARRNLATLAGE